MKRNVPLHLGMILKGILPMKRNNELQAEPKVGDLVKFRWSECCHYDDRGIPCDGPAENYEETGLVIAVHSNNRKKFEVYSKIKNRTIRVSKCLIVQTAGQKAAEMAEFENLKNGQFAQLERYLQLREKYGKNVG